MMACCVAADREAAVREVTQVYELIKLQQPLLLLHSPQHPPLPPSTTQLAQSLLGEALRALNVALSVMKQQQQQPAALAAAGTAPLTPRIKAEPHLSPLSPASADSQQAAIVPSTATSSRGAKRRRSSVPMEAAGKKKTSSSWTNKTAVPYDDGYEWRKYGEKKINGTRFTRSYFRCTYKQDDAGCQATKHVQQMDDGGSDNPPMFQVTYNNHHTCNTSAKANTAGSSNLTALLLAGCCDMKQEPTGHAAGAAAAMNMKQEPPPSSLVDFQPACFPHEQIPQCQEPLFPVSMEQQFCGAFRDDDGEILSATGSCISGETSWWDGYSGDMAAVEDDPLHDLERFLFMDY